MATNIAYLGECVKSLDAIPGVAGFHLDVMDNHFVPNFTFGGSVAKSLRALTSKPFEAHLMVNNPVGHFEQCAESGVSHVFTHIENTEDIEAAIALARELELDFGLAINPETPLAMVEHYVPQLDSLLIMTVNPGFCGQSFMPEVLPKLSDALSLRQTHNPTLRIIVDGGINSTTLKEVSNMGITEVVAGSAVFSGAESGNTKVLQANINKLIKE